MGPDLAASSGQFAQSVRFGEYAEALCIGLVQDGFGEAASEEDRQIGTPDDREISGPDRQDRRAAAG